MVPTSCGLALGISPNWVSLKRMMSWGLGIVRARLLRSGRWVLARRSLLIIVALRFISCIIMAINFGRWAVRLILKSLCRCLNLNKHRSNSNKHLSNSQLSNNRRLSYHKNLKKPNKLNKSNKSSKRSNKKSRKHLKNKNKPHHQKKYNLSNNNPTMVMIS